MEFTRLAQLTKEPKYYDAIARITNELEAWQNNTKLPGLWPLKVDASGCKKPDASSRVSSQNFSPDASGDSISSSSSRPIIKIDGNEIAHIDVGNGEGRAGKDAGLKESSASSAEGIKPLDAKASKSLPTVDDLSRSNVGNIKRQLAEEDTAENTTKTANADVDDVPACEPQGLASPPGSSREEFSMGGQADSAYEYLPKEYMLLGGLEDVYRRMYEVAVERAKKYLLFRPMLPKERNVLLLGTMLTSGNLDNPNDLLFQPEGTHLTCFAGGMFAIGAKVFNREGDMDIARKLTDGCVWAYEATLTGIMPERYLTVPCKNQERCDWNETIYRQMVNIYNGPAETHFEASQQTILDNKNMESSEKPVMKSGQSLEPEELNQSRNTSEATNVTGVSETKEMFMRKRQLADLGNEKAVEPAGTSVSSTVSENFAEAVSIDDEQSGQKGQLEANGPYVEEKTKEKDASEDRAGETSNPPPTPTQEEADNARFSEYLLPIGMATIPSPSYILRYVFRIPIICLCC